MQSDAILIWEYSAKPPIIDCADTRNESYNPLSACQKKSLRPSCLALQRFHSRNFQSVFSAPRDKYNTSARQHYSQSIVPIHVFQEGLDQHACFLPVLQPQGKETHEASESKRRISRPGAKRDESLVKRVVGHDD